MSGVVRLKECVAVVCALAVIGSALAVWSRQPLLAENKPSIRSEDIVKAFTISKETASKDLKQLITLKVFGKTGSGRSTAYFLLKD